jgi:hypothetical protein
MKRALVSLACFSAVFTAFDASPVHSMPQRSGEHRMTGAILPDACGFRRAAWSLVQDTANLIDTVSLSRSLSSLDRGETYLNFKLSGLEIDYDYRSKSLDRAFINVLADLDAAQDALNSESVSDFDTAMSEADGDQQKMWPAIKSVCPQNGPSRVWLGYLNQFGSGMQTLGVTVPARYWVMAWQFDCGFDSGKFIVTIVRPGRSLKGVDELSGGSGGLQFYSGSGHYVFHIESKCAWNVNVRPE